MARGEFDLVVVGAGINGCGIAYDAALNGLRTLLLDKEDVAAGTTAWSSRLIHGGLRYLEGLELGLVHESLRERATLLRIAPHLVEPLELAIPVYKTNRHRLWKVRLGLSLYDWLSRSDGLPRHRRYRRDEFMNEFGSLRVEDLEGAVSYFDARVEFAERLCLEVGIAARRAGACVLGHAEVSGLHVERGRLSRVGVCDRLTGRIVEVPLGADTVVINAAGPWVDEVLARLRRGDDEILSTTPRIGGVKGSHLLIDRFAGAPPTGMYVEAGSDARPYFILPWYGRLLIGTTERRFDSDLDAVSADGDEIDYLLSETNRVIPTASLSRRDVRLAYAGVRALPAATSARLGRITRRHLWVDHRSEGAANLWSLVGGKLTTFRAVGEEAVDRVLSARSRPRIASTAEARLPGAWADGREREEVLRAAIDVVGEVSARLLVRMYGARSAEIVTRVERDKSLGRVLAEGLPDCLAQVDLAFDSESSERLVDLICRRLILPMRHPELLNGLADGVPSLQSLRRHAPLMGQVVDSVAGHLGWDGARLEDEVDELVNYVRAHFIPGYRLG